MPVQGSDAADGAPRPTTRPTRPVPRLVVLVDRTDDPGLLPGLVACGVDGFQVRAKRATTRELLALVGTVREAVGPYAAQVVVNDRLDVALAAGADGVHLGADDLPVADARRVADAAGRRDLLVGATCRDRAAVERARADGADYAGFGPLAATSSKAGLPDPLGVAALTAAAGVLPLLGIGGVDAALARRAVAAGAHGVAVIGAVWRPPDPLAAAQELVDAVS